MTRTTDMLKKDGELRERLHADLDVEASKKVLDAINANSLDLTEDQRKVAAGEAYDAISQRYAGALGIQHNRQAAAGLGYDVAWGAGVANGLFGAHSGIAKEIMVGVAAQNKFLTPSITGAILAQGREKLDQHLRSAIIGEALNDRPDLAQGLTDLVRQAGITENIDPVKLDPEGVNKLYGLATGTDETRTALRTLVNKYKP